MNNSTDLRLKKLATELKDKNLYTLFSEDKDRFDQLLFTLGDIRVDLSKQKINQDILKMLIKLADEKKLIDWIKQLFSMEKINHTESRSAGHWALRSPKDSQDDFDLTRDVHIELEHMYQLVDKIHAGQLRGSTGEPIQNIVNIGVGGSDLGPLMVTYALSEFKKETEKPLSIYFVSTIDGSQFSELANQLRAETTLFIISSKSFTTIDTLSNAETARLWLKRSLRCSDENLKSHFVGVSTNHSRMTEWGIAEDYQLSMWDWVGGRYSLWSCIGLPIALLLGVEGFKDFLQGAYQVDRHFKSTKSDQNIPVLLALIGIWNINYLDIHTNAVLPYDGRLKYFSSYLQQLEMESNGKSITRDDQKITAMTCPIIWGEVGPNAQHAFYQLLHQGTHAVSCDFIVPINRYNSEQIEKNEESFSLVEQHNLSIANCLAQSRLLAFGNKALGESIEKEPLYKQYEGDQPSTTLLVDELTPKTLGMLIALYEHKVFVQSVIWNINPFDQWGVEKGKEIALDILPSLLQGNKELNQFDDSTRGLLKIIEEHKHG